MSGRDANQLAADAVIEAAGPMARLPFPVSSDERDDWRVHQQRLVDALEAYEVTAPGLAATPTQSGAFPKGEPGAVANQLAADDIARRFHETYERLAPEYGYETRQESAVAWEDVPEPNRSLMVAVAAEVHAELVGLVGTLQQERDDLGNALARERAKPEGSFDQWARLQAAEAALAACLKMASAEMPPDEVFRAIQRDHGLPETGRPKHPAETALAETRRALAKYTEGAVVETTITSETWMFPRGTMAKLRALAATDTESA